MLNPLIRDNWVSRKPGHISFKDKIKALKKMKQELLLCHQTEIERINTDNNHSACYVNYVERLYNHYIIEKKSKIDFFK